MSDFDSGITSGVIANLLTQIGVKAVRAVLSPPTAGSIIKLGQNLPNTKAISECDLFLDDSTGETPRFLARQRIYHRINLARSKWDWLVLLTHYHPIRGRPTKVEPEWHPKSIGGQFTI